MSTHPNPGAVRWSWRSRRYEASVAFYRDLLQLPVIVEFSSSFGEDGTVLGVPDSAVHLEILRDRSDEPTGTDQAEIVLYLDGTEAADRATSRLQSAGISPAPRGHPYWEANGAITYHDPDGRAVVFAPWVFGRVPDPVDRPAASGDQGGEVDGSVHVDWYGGDRQALRTLFEEAEDSNVQLDSYIREGRILVARVAEDVVGHLQLTETGQDGVIELKNMAVLANHRGAGIGTRLVEHAIAAAASTGHVQMIVATAAADIDNLRFYQRRGFRLTGVEPDAFDTQAGYQGGTTIDGIPLRDRVWFTRPLE